MRARLWIAPGIVGLAVLLGCVVWFPRLLYPQLTDQELSDAKLDEKQSFDARNERLKLQNDARTTLLQGLGGAVVLLGVFFTWRQLRATQEGQLTDRYTKAVDQLGADKALPVKVGGVYALKRIARDSRDDRQTIAEVLCTYVRTAEPEEPDENLPVTLRELGKRAPDVQAAVEILGRWRDEIGRKERLWLDLHGADLRYARLENADLAFVYFYDAKLQGARLDHARLWKANFWQAQLKGTHLKEADLRKADLRGADLREANLDHTKLGDAEADERTLWPAGWDQARAKGAGVRFANE